MSNRLRDASAEPIRSPGTTPADRVILVLRRYGTMSRAEVARRTGLGKSTVSETVSRLVDAGLVITAPTAPRNTGHGRPGIGISLDPGAGAWIGIDFGMRHVRAVIVDVSHTILATHQTDVEVEYPPSVGLEAAERATAAVLEKSGVSRDRVVAIGAAVPGPVDPKTGIVIGTSMIPTWNGLPVGAALSEKLGRDVLVDNDSNCAALAEQAWGAGRGCANLALFKLHSGVGGAVIANNQLVHGIAGTAGEFGHIPMDEFGPLCRCGGRGCLETYVGIPALLDQLRPLHGRDLTVTRMIELAASRDPAALRVIQEAANIVGRAAAIVASTTGPEVIVIGGALSAMGAPLVDMIQTTFNRHSVAGRQHQQATTRIVLGQLGGHASALGAVVMLTSRLGTSVAL